MSHVPKFHRLAVNDLRRESADAVSLTFAIPRELADDYRFAPGQYLTLRTTTDGECAPRPTSIFPRSFRIFTVGRSSVNEGALVAAPICQAITLPQPCPEKFEIRKFALRCAQIPKL